MKRFNVTGLCVPHKHYMADTSGKIAEIKKLVENECYFTINRARQYGKTTTLYLLKKELQDSHLPVSISFEGLGDDCFASQEAFCSILVNLIAKSLKFTNASNEYIEKWKENKITNFNLLSSHITEMCEDKKIVLMIDEVDATSNNRIFLQFIGMLRSKYLAREAGMDYTFHSVILAGVYDIRNIKLKMINEGAYTPTEKEGKIYNSPWNIAVDFNVDMSLSSADICTMLSEYEKDHNTGMDIAVITDEIHKSTNGYPFLVSRICQHIDEKFTKNWTINGVQNAINYILQEQNMLFDDLSKNLESNKELYDFMYDLLILGDRCPFNIDNPVIRLASMYGYIMRVNGNGQNPSIGVGYAAVSNKIFEMRISNYFISKDKNISRIESSVCRSLMRDIAKDGRFDMELCLIKFAEHYKEIYTDTDIEFLERHGRLLFLSFLRPLINGQGFYHIESQFTDLRKMDITIDYGQEQYIVELKIWRGEKYKKEAYKQLLNYMESKNAQTAYMLTFDFRKEINKQTQAEWVEIEGRQIFDVMV